MFESINEWAWQEMLFLRVIMITTKTFTLPGTPLLLAPMEDITTGPFRKICKSYGAGLVYTEFVSSEGLIRDAGKSLRKLKVDDQERPVAIQIFGHDIASMVKAAQVAAEAGPEMIDLNFGCPVKKVVRKGAGAAMLRDPEKMIAMTREIVQAVDIPVTVKTRLGWDSDNIIIDKLAEPLQETGIAALTIHARTRSQMYKGQADWSYILSVKQNPNIEIPIIGNGDIDSAEKAKSCLEEYNPDALMIGRAAIGNPWIFKQISEYLKSGDKVALPGDRERVEVTLGHLRSEMQEKTEHSAILEMRKMYSGYFKGVDNFKSYKIQLMKVKTFNEVEAVLHDWMHSRK